MAKFNFSIIEKQIAERKRNEKCDVEEQKKEEAIKPTDVTDDLPDDLPEELRELFISTNRVIRETEEFLRKLRSGDY